jgi:hypothetical protein
MVVLIGEMVDCRSLLLVTTSSLYHYLRYHKENDFEPKSQKFRALIYPPKREKQLPRAAKNKICSYTTYRDAWLQFFSGKKGIFMTIYI